MKKVLNKMDENLWVNLKVISKLEPFQKINTRSRLFQISPQGTSILDSIQRWWSKSSRSSDFDRIKDLYELAEKCNKDNKRLVIHLTESLKGLGSLQKTYEDDVTLKARIDCLIEYVHKIIETKSE